MEQESSLPYPQGPATCLFPEIIHLCPRLTVWIFSNKIRFYNEEFLAPIPNPKLEVHPFSAVRDYLFNTFVTKKSDAFRIQVASFTVWVTWPVTFDDTYEIIKHHFVIISLWFCEFISTCVLFVIYLSFTMTFAIITNIQQKHYD
jgi:hypothetical protein